MPGTKKVSTAQSADVSAQPAVSDTFAIQIVLGNPTEYRRAKRLLDLGHHPTFIGRGCVERNAIQGGLIFAQLEKQDVAVAVIGIRNGTLLVLNVHPLFRSRGIGSQLLGFLRPNFARVIESRVAWFESMGYAPLGAMKKGRVYKTQIMVRKELMSIAAKLAATHGLRCPCSDCATHI
jgi:GNAT superfamily N-acetyltransferase